ncbi:MAG: hypothetical protein H7335_00975 [Massilia sp.]|nr:hypothetical protein [Massilia sp.]
MPHQRTNACLLTLLTLLIHSACHADDALLPRVAVAGARSFSLTAMRRVASCVSSMHPVASI